jgi:hypothetical protein
MNTKTWLNSKTVWLMISEATGVWILYAQKKITLLAAVILSVQAVAGIVNRYYTNQPIQRTNGGQ